MADSDRLFVARIAEHDIAEALLQIHQIPREAKDGHDLRGHCNVEAGFTDDTVVKAPESRSNRPERAIVHVDDPAPGHASRVDIELVLPVHVVVDQGREQVMGRADRVEITREMQVDVGHRYDLRVAAAGGAAFHAETGAETGFAQANDGIFADPVKSVAEADRRRRLAFACRCRRYGSNQYQFAVFLPVVGANEIGADLGLVITVGNQCVVGNTEFCGDI